MWGSTANCAQGLMAVAKDNSSEILGPLTQPSLQQPPAVSDVHENAFLYCSDYQEEAKDLGTVAWPGRAGSTVTAAQRVQGQE